MANDSHLYARPPLVTRKFLYPITLKSKPAEIDYEHKETRVHDDQRTVQNELKLFKRLEKINRSVQCGWQDCSATLGSWETLRKHVEKQHYRTSSLQKSKSDSSTMSYLCRYDSCQKSFHDLPTLWMHLLETHLEPLRLKCPVSKCKHKAQNPGRLVHHLSVAHDTVTDELPRLMTVPISMAKRLPHPPIPDQEIMIFTDPPMVNPNPTFDSTKAARKMKILLEDAASMLDEIDSDNDVPKSPFVRIDIPKNINGQEVRLMPRGSRPPSPCRLNDIHSKDDLPRLGNIEGPTVGYLVWKRRFKEAEESGKLPVTFRKRRRR